MKRDATVVPGIDPVTFEVLRLGLDAIADEMAYTIVRSARSTMIKDCMDYSASLCTAQGELIAQAVNIGHDVLDAGRAPADDPQAGGDARTRDCIILSDPYEGGSHPGYLHVRPDLLGGSPRRSRPRARITPTWAGWCRAAARATRPRSSRRVSASRS